MESRAILREVMMNLGEEEEEVEEEEEEGEEEAVDLKQH
jgi:hypothetical protein